jgi:hypothetical protein
MSRLRTSIAVVLILMASSRAGVSQSASTLAEVAKATPTNNSPNTRKPARVFTNGNLTADFSSKPEAEKIDVSAEAAADPQRLDAIAALKGVKSVLDGGANHSQFQEYFLKAKVKVDALPNKPENVPIRKTSKFYEDALALSIARITREMSADSVRYFKAQYATDYEFLSLFSNVPDSGFGKGTFATSLTENKAVIDMSVSSQLLMLRAAQRLDVLR